MPLDIPPIKVHKLIIRALHCIVHVHIVRGQGKDLSHDENHRSAVRLENGYLRNVFLRLSTRSTNSEIYLYYHRNRLGNVEGIETPVCTLVWFDWRRYYYDMRAVCNFNKIS